MKKSGFSLVEVIITIVLVAAIAIGSLEFLRYCASLMKKNDLKLTAAYFAAETMEKYYLNRLGITGSSALPSGELKNKYGGIRSYALSADADSKPYNVLSVTVTWND